MSRKPRESPPSPEKRSSARHGKRSDTSLRKCIVSGEARPRDRMIRFVAGPVGELVPDLDEKLPGRGIWLSAERDMVNTALAKDLFSRCGAPKSDYTRRSGGPVGKPDGQAVYGFSGLGPSCRLCVVAGFEKTAAWLGEGKTGVLLQALDGAPGGHEKVTALAGDLPMVRAFTGRELGQRIGKGPCGPCDDGGRPAGRQPDPRSGAPDGVSRAGSLI